MPDPSLEARLFRRFLQVVLDENLSALECRNVAEALKAGRIVKQLREALEVLASFDQPPPTEVPDHTVEFQKKVSQKDKISSDRSTHNLRKISPNQVFDVVKRRKITKSNLLQYFRQVSGDDDTRGYELLTMRDALHSFYAKASDDDWSLLFAMIDGGVEIDPYLRTILSR